MPQRISWFLPLILATLPSCRSAEEPENGGDRPAAAVALPAGWTPLPSFPGQGIRDASVQQHGETWTGEAFYTVEWRTGLPLLEVKRMELHCDVRLGERSLADSGATTNGSWQPSRDTTFYPVGSEPMHRRRITESCEVVRAIRNGNASTDPI